MNRLLAYTVFLLVIAAGAAEPWRWEAAGPGGGGRFIQPAISPNGEYLLIGSDMGSAFRGEAADGSMYFIPHEQFSFLASDGFFFHPNQSGTVFAAGTRRGLLRSDDNGQSWRPVRLPIEDVPATGTWPPPYAGPMQIAFNSAEPQHAALVYQNYQQRKRHALFLSRNGGEIWELKTMLPETMARLRGLAFRPDGSVLYADDNAIYALGSDDAPEVIYTPKAGKIAFFRAVGKEQRLALNGGTGAYLGVSHDDGKNWTERRLNKPYTFRHYVMSPSHPDTAYLAFNKGRDKVTPDKVYYSTVFRSDDNGRTLKPVLFRHNRSQRYNISNHPWTSAAWGWAEPPQGLNICATDPEKVVATDHAQTYYSENGGKSWIALAAPSGKDGVTFSGGMPVMSAYGYYFDPADRDGRYIAMNDFCNWGSFDGGKSWKQYNEGNAYPHNAYVLLYDDQVPGKVWAGFSRDHDMPHWKWQNSATKITHRGGLFTSTDHGRSWRQIKGTGLPEGTVTGLVLDPASEPGRRTLFAAVYGRGIFKSTDNGENWMKSDNGISRWDLAFFRLRRHRDGSLWAMTSVKLPAVLYRSDDRGETWNKVFSDRQFPYLTDVAFDPADENTVYLSAFSKAPFIDTYGGIRKSVDGGRSWTTLLPGKACWSVAVHPADPRKLFAATYSDGLLYSADGGKNWKMLKEFPTPSPIAVTFDPADPDTLYVSCFGASVYKGSLCQ